MKPALTITPIPDDLLAEWTPATWYAAGCPPWRPDDAAGRSALDILGGPACLTPAERHRLACVEVKAS